MSAIGIDIGGTNLRVGVVDDEGEVLEVAERSTPVQAGRDPDEAGRDLLAALADVLAEVDRGRRLPVGIGYASAVTPDGRALYGPNVATRDLPLRQEVVAMVGHEAVVVVNDANAATWGEFTRGAGTDVDDMVMLTLGTGVGGGVVTGGRLVVGRNGFGGELGHVTVKADGWVCGCGTRGCLEAYASGPSLVRHARDLLETGRASTLAGRELHPADVSDAAAAGDRLAIDAIEEAARWLGVGIASLVNVFDPGAVVIGGGVTGHVGEWLVPVAAAVVPRRLMARHHRQAPPVVTATLGDAAGMIGAARLAGSWAADARH